MAAASLQPVLPSLPAQFRHPDTNNQRVHVPRLSFPRCRWHGTRDVKSKPKPRQARPGQVPVPILDRDQRPSESDTNHIHPHIGMPPVGGGWSMGTWSMEHGASRPDSTSPGGDLFVWGAGKHEIHWRSRRGGPDGGRQQGSPAVQKDTHGVACPSALPSAPSMHAACLVTGFGSHQAHFESAPHMHGQSCCQENHAWSSSTRHIEPPLSGRYMQPLGLSSHRRVLACPVTAAWRRSNVSWGDGGGTVLGPLSQHVLPSLGGTSSKTSTTGPSHRLQPPACSCPPKPVPLDDRCRPRHCLVTQARP